MLKNFQQGSLVICSESDAKLCFPLAPKLCSESDAILQMNMKEQKRMNERKSAEVGRRIITFRQKSTDFTQVLTKRNMLTRETDGGGISAQSS